MAEANEHFAISTVELSKRFDHFMALDRLNLKVARFMGIGQVLTMPLFFASNALYPLDLMPAWLRTIAGFNPLTYLVDVLRGAMIMGGQSNYAGSTSFGVMLLVFAVLLALASRLYPGLAR
jgi:ABC-2 type transport system permease protein